MLDTSAGIRPVALDPPQRGAATRGALLHSLLAALIQVPPLHLFVPSVYLNCGLRFGRGAMVWAVVLSSVFLGGLSLLGEEGRTVSAVLTGGFVLLAMGVPAVLGLELIDRRVPFGLILVAMAGVGALGLLLLEGGMRLAWSFSPYGELLRSTELFFQQLMEMSSGAPAERRRSLEWISGFMQRTFVPAIVLFNLALMYLASMILVPRLRAGRWTGEAYRLRNLSLPEGLLFVFVAAGLSPLAQGTVRLVGLNVLAVVTALYWLQGIAVVRMIMTRSAGRFLSSGLAFMLLLILTLNFVGIGVLVLAGLFDSFFDFRRLTRKENSDESNSD